MKTAVGVRRYKGRTPKVGIRPVIDGRRKYVRESLEGPTMKMAESVARLISRNLYYSNGLPVECIISDTCIGGTTEAAQAAEKFEKEGVGVSITVTSSWCYGTEVMDSSPLIPKAIWGFNGTERPGAVYLAAALAAYSQLGQTVFGIYGREVQDRNDEIIPAEVEEKLLRFTKAALAVAEMKGKTYLSIGAVSMGIAGSMVDHNFLSDYLGMRAVTVDMSELVRRIEENIYDEEEFNIALGWVRKNCREGKDTNPQKIQSSRERKDYEWETIIKMTLICRDMMIGNNKLNEKDFKEEASGQNAIAAGFQGQRQWTDHFPNGDFTEAILNSSFDWNGIREPFIFATENDYLNGICMLLGHLLTDTAQIFADVRSYWSPESVNRVTGKKLTGNAANGIIHLINSGSASLDGTGRQVRKGKPVLKPFWEISVKEVKECLKATTWYPAELEYFRGGGFSSNYLTSGGMPLTMFRLNIIKGLGPVLQLAEGYSIQLPDSVHEVLNARTNPTWPTTWFAPNLTGQGAFTDVYSVMANWGANHCVVSYGHIGDLLITLASMLRIPVNMHNIERSRIFRPSAWNAFGTEYLECADIKACDNFGSLYG
ncbi:MAG: L-fucose isomerase [Melioribacteraceae bacterium]|nr:L-fucose isomerase [Melioribacteraceae bacterium]